MTSVVAALCALVAGGCAATRNAQGRDPMQCERNPDCARARESFADCTKQCVDDPECTTRCEEVEKQEDGLGH